MADIPKEFVRYYRMKSWKRPCMTLDEMWAMWQPYWHLRHNGPNTLEYGDQYVLGRYGDKGDYTVGNCRVITHRENTLERDHKKCSAKLVGKVHNPRGGATVKNRKQVKTPLGVFDNCSSAGKAHGIHRSSMWHRVTSEQFTDYTRFD